MNITQDDICQLTCGIWESTLGLEVRPVPGAGLSEQRAGIVISRVQITGAWLGTVLLECSESLAKDVARIMFGLDSEEPTPGEVRDALAEITNITAGNFKSWVGGHCHLSMPQVTDPANDQPTAPEGAVLTRQAFDCQSEPFVVTILEGEVFQCNPN
jgi:CheY-specific phosphatase CheX